MRRGRALGAGGLWAKRSARVALLLSASVAASLMAGSSSVLAGPRDAPAGPNGGVEALGAARRDRPLVLAYYYIWYEPGSWDRAKSDLPRLGTYSSADPTVIAQHVAWAKASGIDALIVSWKHEPRLDGPLATLVDAARAADLGLVLLYQGLDFFRQPLDAGRIGDDLAWFVGEYGDDPAFDVFGGPTIVFSGTPSFSVEQIASVRDTALRAGPVRLLGSERSAEDYASRREVLDGDAYYWSSVDPTRDRGYLERLEALAASIRDDGGLWLAPVAPGFDARLVGGTRVVDRADGATYRTEWKTALATDPDGLAIISWNEFSENSHIEPSAGLGTTYLALTSELVRGTLGRPAMADPASATGAPVTAGPSLSPVVSEPDGAMAVERLVPLVVAGLLLLSLAVLARRPQTRTSAKLPDEPPAP